MRRLISKDIDGARKILDSPECDQQKLGYLLDKSRLAGYVYTLITDTSLSDRVQPEILSGMKISYLQQEERSRKSQALHLDIKRNLGDASIPFLTLKGLYLTQRFYGAINRRFMWDVDILVHPGDMNSAISAMKSVGLEPQSVVRFDPQNKLWGIHAVEVRGEAGKLDIHYAIRNLPKVNFDNDRLWRMSQSFSFNETTFTTLSDEDTLLIASIGLGADLQNSHHTLRKIWDVYQIISQLDSAINWQAFFAERERERSLKLIVNVLSFCLLLVGKNDDCPTLRSAMSPYQRLLIVSSAQQADRIFVRDKQHLANRLLFSRLLPISPVHYWLRWLITLPVRVWHYR